MAATTSTPRVTIIGAGMSGSLLAIFLARRGFEVDVYERRGDLRCKKAGCSGRSIKMTLAERGLKALREVGLESEVMRFCVPLRGRAVHTGQGTVTSQPYGKNDREVILSISRTDLNAVLLNHAGSFPQHPAPLPPPLLRDRPRDRCGRLPGRADGRHAPGPGRLPGRR